MALLALAALGGFDMVSMVIRGALVQLDTPDEMRGRVNAVNAIFINTSNQLGEFESGLLAAWFGAVPAAAIGGVGTRWSWRCGWRCSSSAQTAETGKRQSRLTFAAARRGGRDQCAVCLAISHSRLIIINHI